MDKVKLALTIVPIFLFTIFMGNFIYRLLNEKPPIKVVIIDTGLSNFGYKQMCKDGHKSFTANASIKDTHPRLHGSNVAAIIEREAGPGNWCFIMLKFTEQSESSIVPYLAALKHAATLKPVIINISVTGRTFSPRESVLVRNLLDKGVTIIAAAGNDGEYISKHNCNVYPACLDPRIYVIGNSGSRTSNKGPFVDTFINGEKVPGAGVRLSGTSQSTAIFTGQLLKQVLKDY